MIDTVKIRVHCGKELIEKIKGYSRETTRKNNIDNSKELNFFNCSVLLPSYFRGVNIFHDSYKDDVIYFEVSLPKFVFGNNIQMISIEEAKKAFASLYEIFIQKFGEFPLVETWEVTRIDLCYNWVLPTYEEAVSLLGFIRSLDYPRKKTVNFESSVYASSRGSTVKFYLKGEEFKAHDFKSIRKFSRERAEYLRGVSQNILRFEIELRTPAILSEFDKKFPSVYTVLVEQDIIKILNKYFNKAMNNQATNFTTDQEIYSKLLRYCKSSEQAIHLYEFYKLWHSQVFEERKFLELTYGKRTIRRKKELLRKAKIGIISHVSSEFKFTIPSKNNSNNYLQARDRASDLGYMQ